MLLAICSVVYGLPQAEDDVAVTYQDTPVLISALDNDTGTGISIASLTQPSHGAAQIVGTQIRYAPERGYCGSDAFTYTIMDGTLNTDSATVSVTVHCANSAPQAEDTSLSIPMGTRRTFTLRATDPDLDGDNPAAHPLSFELLSGPKHGTLHAELTAVRYTHPHTAYVVAVYTPEHGFEGLDSISFMVSDPFGAIATGLVEINVVRRGYPLGTFSGAWGSTLVVRAPPAAVARFDSTLTTNYRTSGLGVEGSVSITNSQFNAFKLAGELSLGRLSVRPTLQFDPQSPTFQFLQNLTQFELVRATWTHTFYLTGDEATSYSQLAGTWDMDDFSFSSTTRFRGITLGFVSHLFSVRWLWFCCKLPTEVQLQFTKIGFESLRAILRDVHIPCSACGHLELYADIDTTYTVDSKTVVPTLKLRSDWECCVRGYFDLSAGTSGPRLFGFEFYGFEVRLTLEGGIELRAATSFVYERNAAVTGFSEYFEVWSIRGPILPCCGAPGWWQISTYFDEIPHLFGWGMTRATVELPVGRVLRAFTQVSVRADPSPWQWEWQVGGTLRF